MKINSGAQPPRAGRREWAGLSVLVTPALLISMDLSVLYLAVPHLSADLGPSSSQLLWITDSYGFWLAGFLVTMGTVGDRIGRRRLLMIGAALFGVASVLAAYSSSAEMLIVARSLLGIAGATLAPSTLSLISNMFADDKQRATAIAVWATSLSVGGALGPVVGGTLLEWFWWGSVFLIAVPIMVVLLASAPVLLPEHRNASAGRPDVVSVVLALVAVLSVIYALKQIAQGGLDWSSGALVAAGALVGLIFVRRQRRLAEPMIDLRLFGKPAFSMSLVVNSTGFFVVLGLGLYLAQYLQLVLGLSPLKAGLAMVPMFAGFVGGAMVSPLLIQRIRPAVMMAGGIGLGAAGVTILTLVRIETGLAAFITGSVVMAVGLGPVFPLVTNLVLRSVAPERAGVASGMAETSTEFGGALGIAILGVVGTAVYRGAVADRIPAAVPADVAASARETLGGAAEATAQLPADVAESVLASAQAAFTSALHAAAVVSAIALAAIAAVAYLTLRHEMLDEPVGHTPTGGEHP